MVADAFSEAALDLFNGKGVKTKKVPKCRAVSGFSFHWIKNMLV